ncbi:FkbM family methyltransferase [Alienimonas sp. DA493]|uniref:FkbM family methyltransferase n=1 Tax=Alienimonas sp. DA493 TaxID=3373605 RepID=UPI003753E9D0
MEGAPMKLHRRVARSLGYSLVRIRKDHSILDHHLAKVMTSYGVNVVVDVGANKGQFGSLLRSGGYTGLILSFEPVAECYRALQAAAEGDDLWRTFNCALGREEAELSINVAENDTLSSFRTPSEFGRDKFPDRIEAGRTETVPVKRLDALFDDAVRDVERPTAFLKMDTQGFDLDVFAGAEGCLDRVVGVQSELSALPIYEGMPDYVESLSTIRAAGYEVSGFFPISRQSDSLLLVEFDVVMLRKPVAADESDG